MINRYENCMMCGATVTHVIKNDEGETIGKEHLRYHFHFSAIHRHWGFGMTGVVCLPCIVGLVPSGVEINKLRYATRQVFLGLGIDDKDVNMNFNVEALRLVFPDSYRRLSWYLDLYGYDLSLDPVTKVTPF